MKRFLTILAALSLASAAFAAGGVDGPVEKQALIINAIIKQVANFELVKKSAMRPANPFSILFSICYGFRVTGFE